MHGLSPSKNASLLFDNAQRFMFLSTTACAQTSPMASIETRYMNSAGNSEVVCAKRKEKADRSGEIAVVSTST